MATLTILSKNIWRLSTMSDTQHTPTDSEMLDWMFKKCASVIEDGYVGDYCVKHEDGYICENVYPTPRAAIAAEMAKESK
jgi:hypothetical protein